MIEKNGYLAFHQGWTDIINQLALINYYTSLYRHITLVMRSDAKLMVDFYTRNIKNLTIRYCPFTWNMFLFEPQNAFLLNTIMADPEREIIFHGLLDQKSERFPNAFWDNNPTMFFTKKFYINYGLDYNLRVSEFELERDLELETQKYEEFVKIHGPNYILYHEDPGRNIVFNKFQQGVPLNKTTDLFWDYITILIHAQEIHVIDSSWSVILYHLDAKYKLFHHLPITVHCLRGYRDMFTEPIKLPHWKLI